MRTIRRTVTCATVSVVLLIVSVTFVAVFFFMRSRMLEQFDSALRTTAETIAGLIEIDRDQVQLDERDESLTEFRRLSRPSFFDIRDLRGRSLLRSPALRQPLNGPFPDVNKIAQVTLPDGRQGRMISLSVLPHVEVDDERSAPNVETVAPVQLFVSRDTSELDSTLALMAVTFAAAVVVLVGTIGAVMPLLVRRGLKPLDDLSDQARLLDSKDLAGRFVVDHGPAELLPIAERLNESLDRIEAAFSRERRFAADAAHELRTPLAAIRTNAEVALKWSDPEQVQSSLTDIASASVRLQRLVNRLLELARANVVETTDAHVDVDLVALLHQSIARTGASSKREVTIDASPSVFVNTYPDIVGTMLDNLLLNAITHSPADSDVVATIRLINTGGTVLTITNDAPHLTQDDLARMFEPLWTKSDDRSGGHSGLGLALVAEHAAAIGIRVTSGLDQASRITLSIIFP